MILAVRYPCAAVLRFGHGQRAVLGHVIDQAAALEDRDEGEVQEFLQGVSLTEGPRVTAGGGQWRRSRT